MMYTLDEALVRTAMPPTRDELIAAQRRYAAVNHAPLFAPMSGYCWNCNADIVEPNWATSLVTYYCRRCGRSYCD